MVIEFLQELRSEFLEQKLDLESERNNLCTKRNDNKKFIEKLKEKEGLNFDAFSPRKQNFEIKEQVNCLETENQSLSQKIDEIEQKLEALKNRLDQFDCTIKNVRKKEAESLTEEKFSDSLIFDLKHILKKVKFCESLVQTDPIRCKMELSLLLKMISQIIPSDNEKIQEVHSN